MCLGDSITLGTASDATGGYRGFLWQLMPGFRPIGTSTQDSLLSMLGTTAYDQHEGFGGQNISIIASSLPGYLAAVGAPDVVLFNTGANDAWDYTILAPKITIIHDLFVAANPNVKFIQSCPTINPGTGNPTWVSEWSTNQPLIGAFLATLSNTITCPMPFLQDSELFDGLHPNVNGYIKMAAAWSKILCQLNIGL
jgi:lysophospholipase L1-like esterase